jgi:ubiquinone/menaquinone biosynthesis C-methylase UbiE
MTPEEYRYLYELEEHHWWFQGMRRITAALLEGQLPAGPLRILDAGCGTGLMLSWLRARRPGSSSYGVDISSDALRYCSLRGERLLVQGSVAELPLPADFFDLVVSFDVLDRFALSEAAGPFGEMARVLKPGGLMLVRVPAFQFLYSEHDAAVFTAHRYRLDELDRCLSGQGLQTELLTYANTLLFPAAALWRWMHRKRREGAQSDVRPLPKAVRWLNPLLASLLYLEASWLRHVRWPLPVGLSAIALARKPAGNHRT